MCCVLVSCVNPPWESACSKKPPRCRGVDEHGMCACSDHTRRGLFADPSRRLAAVTCFTTLKSPGERGAATLPQVWWAPSLAREAHLPL